MAVEIKKPTREDVEDLKREWKYDPLWDIEKTEGFEEYHDELLKFRDEVYAENEKRYKEELQAFADAIGIPDNLKLAEYLRRLERNIDSAAEYNENAIDRIYRKMK